MNIIRGNVVITNDNKSYVIISNNKCNEKSTVISGLPIEADCIETCYVITKFGKVLCGHIEPIATSEIIDIIGVTSSKELNEIVSCIKSRIDTNIDKDCYGGIFYANLPQIKNCSIQSGRRPVLVVGKNSNYVNIIPLTSKDKKKLPTHSIISKKDNMKYDSLALCEQPATISSKLLNKRIGYANVDEMKNINKCICIQLGI